MAFFLKVMKQHKQVYLAIYESFYSADSKGTRHRCHKSLGTVEKLKESGIDDPIKHYREEVERMNAEREGHEARKITSVSPRRYLGYFPLRSIIEDLDIRRYIDLFKLTTNYDFDLYEALSLLIFARCVAPCSKHRTYNEILPQLGLPYSFSYDQLLAALSFYGNDYEKIVELFTKQVRDRYSIDASVTYFDCTNFYFEIDREDDFRRKGPSKENRKDSIVGLGLLLDANQIPIGMRMYPGNESEKPVLRDVIAAMKDRCEVKGRTIQVADKGLNCARNIIAAVGNGDGYLFSKSVKQLPDVERNWVLFESGYRSKKDGNGDLLYSCKECVETYRYSYVDEEGRTMEREVEEKRVATYSPSLAQKKKYEISRLVEKAKGLSCSLAKRSEYGESSRYVTFKSTSDGKETDDKVKAVINQKMIDEDMRLAGYNLLVTSEKGMSAERIYETYHNLWRIEESFRIMKSDLDARPVFLQLEDTIKGHFLVCYLMVLLQRIFQFGVLGNRYPSSTLKDFYKGFQLVDGGGTYTNITIGTDFITELSKKTNLPLDHYLLSQTKVSKILNYRFGKS